MKKLIALMLVLAMCLSLLAWGGPDVQPAIDAYNEVSENFNKFADIANENLDDFTDEDIELLNGCADVLNEYADKLENETEFTQEEIDEMVAIFEEFNVAILELLAVYE